MKVLKPEPLDLNHIVDRMDGMLRRLIGTDLDFVTKLEPHLDCSIPARSSRSL